MVRQGLSYVERILICEMTLGERVYNHDQQPPWEALCLSRSEPIMTDSRKEFEATHFLCGWKDIANYLGKGVRTVQRYECHLGLPVRRPAGKSRGSVVATKAELDAWVSASPIRHAFSLTKPADDSRYQVSATAIKNGLEEMGRLRDQMMALREEVRSSVSLLRQSIKEIHGGIDGQWPATRLPLTVSEIDSRTKDILDLLATPGRHPKAS